MRRLLIVACSIFAVTLIGCPPTSGLKLGGDPELVGTWEGTAEIMGYTVNFRVTYGSDGSYYSAALVPADNSGWSAGGKWYADPQKGWLDEKREWIYPPNNDALGTFKSLYEINGNTLEAWNDPVNMPRPASRTVANVHATYTRQLNKVEELPEFVVPGACQDLMELIP